MFFFRKQQKNKEDIQNILEKLFNYLMLFSFSIFLFLGIFGEEMFLLFLGDSWIEAGVYAQILSFYLFCKFITLPCSYLMIIYQKQEYSLYLNLTIMTLSIFSLLIGGILENVYLALLLFSLSNSLAYLAFGIGFMNYSGILLFKILKIILNNLIKNIPIALILIMIKMNYNSSDIFTIAFIILVVLINLLVILFSTRESREEILKIIK